MAFANLWRILDCPNPPVKSRRAIDCYSHGGRGKTIHIYEINTNA